MQSSKLRRPPRRQRQSSQWWDWPAWPEWLIMMTKDKIIAGVFARQNPALSPRVAVREGDSQKGVLAAWLLAAGYWARKAPSEIAREAIAAWSRLASPPGLALLPGGAHIRVGSGRQYACDRGGRIVTALRRIVAYGGDDRNAKLFCLAFPSIVTAVEAGIDFLAANETAAHFRTTDKDSTPQGLTPDERHAYWQPLLQEAEQREADAWSRFVAAVERAAEDFEFYSPSPPQQEEEGASPSLTAEAITANW